MNHGSLIALAFPRALSKEPEGMKTYLHAFLDAGHIEHSQNGKFYLVQPDKDDSDHPTLDAAVAVLCAVIGCDPSSERLSIHFSPGQALPPSLQLSIT